MKGKMQKGVISFVMTILMTLSLLPANFLGGGVIRAQASAGQAVIDVWDFGAEEFSDTDSIDYNNNLTVDVLKTIFDSNGKTTNASVDFTNGLTWSGKEGHRLYTSNGELSSNRAGNSGLPEGMTGKFNLNGASADWYFELAASAGDKITVWCDGDNNADNELTLSLSGETTVLQSADVAKDKAAETIVSFYIPAANTYKIGNSISGKMNYSRIQKETAVQKTITGTVTGAPEATIGDVQGQIVFTNSKSGQKCSGEVKNNTYSVDLPAITEDVTYGITFSDDQYAITSSKTFVLSRNTEKLVCDVNMTQVATCSLSGSIIGFADGYDLSKLELSFSTEADTEFVPEVTLDNDAKTYSATIEKNVTYIPVIKGANDYYITDAAFSVSDTATKDLTVALKPTYPITLSLGSKPDLSGKNVTYTFTNEEDGYVYTFTDRSGIALRDGTYKVSLSGDIDQLPYQIKSGDKLTVSGQTVNHPILFGEVTSWVFGDKGFGTGKAFNQNTGYYQGLYMDGTTGKVEGRSSDAQLNSGAVIKVPVTGNCSITVTANGGAQYALYTINGTAASTTDISTTVEYTGGTGTVDIVATGTAYISSISITYPPEEVTVVQQAVMPFATGTDTDALNVMDMDNIPKGSKEGALVIQPVGQKLNFVNSGSSLNNKLAQINNVGYYVFPMTSDLNVLEFDVVVTTNTSTGDDSGFFGGIFTNSTISTLGLRKGGTEIRGIYTKNSAVSDGIFTAAEFSGAGSPVAEKIELNNKVHYTITRTSDKKTSVTISFADANGVQQTRSFSQGLQSCETGDEVYYGFIVTNVSATITNMVYKDAQGNILYAQNSAYTPKGSIPVASNVTAVAAESREYIDVSWQGTVAEDDATYVVEVQKDGGEWIELTDDVTGFSYRYEIPAGEGGNYLFRVCGQLGKKDLGGSRNDYETMGSPVYVLGALAKPILSITSTASDVTVSWDAVSGAEYYQVYRYSYDEGEAAAVCVKDRLTEIAYKDADVTQEVPYYYYVKAVSDSTNNASPYSETVWAVPTSGHTGDYVYENEATEIFITKKSYDTVFTDQVTLEGIVYGDGTLAAQVNGKQVQSMDLSTKGSFSFKLTVLEGRNDVNLLFTDKNGKVTRKTFNFVYLTNYDMVVDASFTGTDGTNNADGIPTYKTVQAAVDSVPGGNADSKVILVMAGSYEERLVVNTPYISIIGEDRESTRIHCYPGVLGEKYEAGEDMTMRCATYIQNGATGFSAENITFENDYVYGTADGKSNKSADAVRVDADQSSFVNVKFVSVQDTLYMDAGKQYYDKCRIEGLVDYIYSGDKARSFFNDCELVFVYEPTKTSGYVCAPKTAADAEYGLTFYNCVITAEEGCAGTGYLLARPWGPNAYVTWIDCYMGKAVYEIQPYGSMSGNMPEDARFYEFGSYGPGYAINANRRQISPTKAAEMVTDGYLGWSPATVSSGISADHYVGSVVTSKEEEFVTKEPNDDKYLWTDGDDTGLKQYDMEGYSTVYGVTGGGLLKEVNDNYYKVATAEEFLKALIASKTSGKGSVIELTADINLGSREVANYSDYSAIIKEAQAQPLTHPTLITSGMSQLTFDGVNNLTIFSSNGSSIKHAVITFKRSENIIIRNIKFDELWEWDEATNGDYDRNDWDYITIDDSATGIWIDHCTFYKAYDGVVDIKNPNPTSNITISWCEFLPGSENDTFFDVMMNELASHPDKYPYYQHLLDEGMTKEQIYAYAYGQKKTHLLGQSDDATNAAGIRLTLANNYYKNSMDRMPRLRYGNAHVYNCIMDAQELLDVRSSISNPDIAEKIVSNGASSTCGGQVLLENCYISGIENALNSGNGSSPSGYINAINSVYYMNGNLTKLEPKCNSTGDTRVLITDADAFIAALPYTNYELYDASSLKQIIIPSAGAGKLNLTVLQWEKTSYNAVKEKIVVSDTEYKMEIGEIPATILTEEIKKATGCKTVKELIAYLKAVITGSNEAKVILEGIDEKNTSAMDITIMISFDGGKTWEKATKENFPKNGMDIVIPYPEGTNKSDYDFVVGHLITMGANGSVPGTMEYYKPQKTLSGLQIHINSASPFVIGWKEAEVDEYDGEAVDSVSTGDKTPVVPLAVIMFVSAGVCGTFFFKKRKRA